MNAGLAETPPLSSSQPTSVPLARRLQKFRLVNARFVIGGVLVMLAIGLGARVVSVADQTESMWSLRSELPQGAQITPDDVVLVDVRLTDSEDRYVAADSDVVGKTLTRDVGEGELLPSDAIRDSECGSLVSIPVQPRHLPSTLHRGAYIDVYATGAGDDGTTEQLLTGSVVEKVNTPGGGAVAASGEWAVVVRISQAKAAAVINAIRVKTLDITVVPEAGTDGDPCAPPPGDQPDGEQASPQPQEN